MGHTPPLKLPPAVFIFVGHSGAGKTTFCEQLVAELAARGYAVATIKHAHHSVALDQEGKDSWRYKKAGASMSMLVTTGALQLVADAHERREPAELAGRFLGEADFVLAEGFSQAAGEKIEVLRRACGKPPRCQIADGLIALVSDCPEVYPELPHFALTAVAETADFLIQRAGR